MEEIKKVADEFRKKDGNDKIRNKDMLWYLVKKIDRMEWKLDQKVSWSEFKWFIGVTVIVLGGILSYFIYL